ncbi:MAG: hypothetical protein ACI9WS_000084, partial [Paraglaciecola psychrophila]
ASVTGLQRPKQFKQLLLSEQQAKRWEAETSGFFESIDDVPEEGVEAGGDVGGYNSFWLDPGTKAMRVNGEIRSSILTSPANGQLPFRLGARFKLFQFLLQDAMDGPEQRLLGERCLMGFGSTAGPPMLPVVYNNHYQIVQSPGHVMILVEMIHDARIVRLEGEHVADVIRPWLGDSIGHWQDDTLVVETKNFNPGQSFRAGLRSQYYLSSIAKVTERFTRVSAEEIVYQFTVDDPGAYSEKWTGEMSLRQAKGPIYEYACHEGNYAMSGIMKGARLEESEQ